MLASAGRFGDISLQLPMTPSHTATSRRSRLQSRPKQLAIRGRIAAGLRHRPWQPQAWVLGLCFAAIGCTNPAGSPQQPSLQTAAGASGAPVAAPAGAGAAAPASAVAGAIAASTMVSMPSLPSAGISGMLDAGAKPMSSDAAPSMNTMNTRDDEDAGAPMPAAPTCSDDRWSLAPGFLLSRHVDYVEDRSDLSGLTVFSSAGTACATAKNPTRCIDDLGFSTGMVLGRHLATTTGDKVEFWANSAAVTLFGLIDTPAEAIWLLSLSGLEAPCTLKVSKVDRGYRIENVPKPDYGCKPLDAGTTDAGPQLGSVFVRDDSAVQPEWANESPCGIAIP